MGEWLIHAVSYRGWSYAVRHEPDHPAGPNTWRAKIIPSALGGGGWREIHVLATGMEDAWRLAQECIDYEYRVAVFEFLEGRAYDPVRDGPLPANE